MRPTVALGQRTRLAALLSTALTGARALPAWREPDPRSLRTLRQLVLAVLVARSTRLLALARPLLPQRAARTAKAAAMGLGYFLRDARTAAPELGAGLAEAALGQVPPAQFAACRGRVLLVVDPTEDPKRSRGRGRRGRQMEHIGRVRKRGKRSETTYGDVDVWAGLALKGKRFLPLARGLFSSADPRALSQNQVEERVMEEALAAVARQGRPAIVVGDRGLGRKELLVGLAKREQPYVLRVGPDINARPLGEADERPLAAVLADAPWRGEGDWARGEAGTLRCRLRWAWAVVRFNRSGRQADAREALVAFVEAAPCDGSEEPLLLATTLPVTRRVEARGIVRVYAQRWAIEAAFETMKGWGLGAFMVRSWAAIERLLWVVAVAYALSVLAVVLARLAGFRATAEALLAELSARGRRLTPGKLAEAVALDFARHHRAWTNAWLL